MSIKRAIILFHEKRDLIADTKTVICGLEAAGAFRTTVTEQVG